MSKDAQDSVTLDEAARKKFEECVAALTAMKYGPEGPPKDTTFAEIEQFGHSVGRMLARAVDERLTVEHSRSFQNEAPCPTCQTLCELKKEAAKRELQTCDGKVPISEPVCHCSVCNRDFFPSAFSPQD